MAAHSHHLWPDASFVGHLAAWADAARLADRKWERVMGEIWPGAQTHVAQEISLPDPATVVFAPSTHDLIVRIVSAMDRPRPLRVLASGGEFHSFARQAARWVEAGEIVLETVATGAGFGERFVERARSGDHDLIFVSQVMFGTGQVFGGIDALAVLARPDGPWVVVDGYHGFMAVPTDLSRVADRLFYVAGGYKYAMAGEGCAFLHAPPGFGPRPVVSGWYAAFEALEREGAGIGFAADARRFLGATFDPSGLYRFVAVRDMLACERLDTPVIAAHVATLRERLLAGLGGTVLAEATLLNPPEHAAQARFLALRHPRAAEWKAVLDEEEVVSDVRGDVLRLGLGLYHEERCVDRFLEVAGRVLR